jgi:hypothetical protein
MSYGNVERKAKRRSCIVALVFGLLSTSCGGPKRGEDDVTATTIKIDRLEPSSTGITVPFNVRADGQAVLAVFGTDLPAEAAVFWNDQQLETSRGGDFFAAVVPFQSVPTAWCDFSNCALNDRHPLEPAGVQDLR